MVVHNFNITHPVLVPFKANPPLVINADTVLALTVALEGFQAITWGDSQIGQHSRGVELQEPPPGYPIWPRWFSTVCFVHNRVFSNWFVLGLVLDTLIRTFLPAFWH